ncbi:vegetative incompatibility protein HET-E-1, putative, partial [Rhizoctonia solani AG-3 Rhs1AP]
MLSLLIKPNTQAASNPREEYDQLTSQLQNMTEILTQTLAVAQMKGPTKRYWTLAQSVEKEIQELAEIRRRWDFTARRLVNAEEDKEDLVHRMQRVEGLFHQIKTETDYMNELIDRQERLTSTYLEKLDPVMLARYDSPLPDMIDRHAYADDTNEDILNEIYEWLRRPDAPSCWSKHLLDDRAG